MRCKEASLWLAASPLPHLFFFPMKEMVTCPGTVAWVPEDSEVKCKPSHPPPENTKGLKARVGTSLSPCTW